MGKEPRRSVRDNRGLTPVKKKETTGRKEKREREKFIYTTCVQMQPHLSDE